MLQGLALAPVVCHTIRVNKATPSGLPTVTQLSQDVATGFQLLIEEGDTREIGKFLAFTTEKVIAPRWLSDACGIETVSAPDDEEGQQPKYDLQAKSGLRIQIKFRGGKTLHMEQTRRTTGKNAGAGAKNGQVRYSVDSFDVILFVIPTDYADPTSWEYLAIPAEELEDPNMPGFCVGNVPAAVRKRYTGKAQALLSTLNEIASI